MKYIERLKDYRDGFGRDWDSIREVLDKMQDKGIEYGPGFFFLYLYIQGKRLELDELFPELKSVSSGKTETESSETRRP
jgi:hypothetical protein